MRVKAKLGQGPAAAVWQAAQASDNRSNLTVTLPMNGEEKRARVAEREPQFGGQSARRQHNHWGANRAGTTLDRAELQQPSDLRPHSLEV